MLSDSEHVDAVCFRLSRLGALMDEAAVSDYRRWQRPQIEAAELEVKCSIGRDRFREGVERHGEWLRSLAVEEYRRSSDWQLVRYFALRHAGYRCQECGAGRELEVYHRTFEWRGVERLADVVTLCRACRAPVDGEMSLAAGRRRGFRRLDPVRALGLNATAGREN